MKPDKHQPKCSTSRLIRRLGLVILLLIIFLPGYGQNTKGDQPSKPTRESRFKSKSKKSKSKTSGKRVSPKGKSWGSSALKSPKEKGRAWKGDITGRKVPAVRARNKKTKNDDSYGGVGGRAPKRITPRSISGQARNVYPQKGPYVAKKRSPSKGDVPLKRSGSTTTPPKPRSISAQHKNVFPQRGPWVAKKKPPTKGDAARKWKGGASSQAKIRSVSGKNKNVFPQSGQYAPKTKPPSKGDNPIKWWGSTVAKQKIRRPTGASANVYQKKKGTVTKTRPSSSGDKAWKGGAVGGVKIQSATGKTRNVFKQKGPYVSNPSTQPRTQEEPPGKRLKSVPASGTKPFIRNKSINPYAGFWNKKPKKERAYTGDISGKKLRQKNYETPRQPIVDVPTTPYQGYLKKRRVGDKAYSGKAAGGHATATKSGKAWQGDISGRKLRDRNQSSKGLGVAGKPLLKMPFTGDARVGAFSGKMKYKKPLKGGGSVSGKLFNNDGKPLVGKTPRTGSRAASFQGNMKARKQDFVNVGGFPKTKVYSKVPLHKQGADFSGFAKTKRPAKGGGSVSGKLWNNNERPLVGKSPGIGAKAGNFQGNIKVGKKEPTDVSGIPKGQGYKHVTMTKQGVDFAGFYKTKRPKKGGGSVSGELWNNKEQAISGRGPKGTDLEMAKYQGNVKARKKSYDQEPGNYQGNVKPRKKGPGAEVDQFPGKHRMFDLHPSMRDQGEEYTGNIRRSKLKNDYIRNSYTSKEALKKERPDKTTYMVDGLQVRVKQQDYKKKPSAADGSLPGIGPGKSSIKASEFAKGIKRDWRYIRNESADDEAQKVREPGKAFGKTTDYQGNIKMKKYEWFAKKNLHPDAQFVKTNKNNVKEEKNIVTNFKLLWARLFKKSDTQPDHLKEKIRKPRYDKGEVGLWYN